MGNCCRKKVSKSFSIEPVQKSSVRSNHRRLILRRELFLICLDTHPTAESSRLKTRLKGKFGSLISYNRERTLVDIVQLPESRKYLIIIFGEIQQKTLDLLINNSNVLAIYFYSTKSQFDHRKSNKVKGQFSNESQIEFSIENDFSLK